MPSSLADIVYPLSRYVQGQAPAPIYIPSKEIMINLMRACVSCGNEQELWIHQGRHQNSPQ